MAKKRIITQDMNYDEDFNSLPIGSQILFIRFLTIADDCGVIPANEYTLHALINTPPEIKRNYSKLLENILEKKMMFKFQHDNKDFLCFKRKSYEEQQKFLIKNRTKSEYLKLQLNDFFDVYSKLLEITGNYSDMEHINIKNKDKELRIKIENKDKEGEKNFFKVIPPTIEKVLEICKERNYPEIETESEKFFNYYESNGWKVGKNPVKDWGALLSNWFKNYKNYNNGNSFSKGFRGNTGGKLGQDTTADYSGKVTIVN